MFTYTPRTLLAQRHAVTCSDLSPNQRLSLIKKQPSYFYCVIHQLVSLFFLHAISVGTGLRETDGICMASPKVIFAAAKPIRGNREFPFAFPY